MTHLSTISQQISIDPFHKIADDDILMKISLVNERVAKLEQLISPLSILLSENSVELVHFLQKAIQSEALKLKKTKEEEEKRREEEIRKEKERQLEMERILQIRERNLQRERELAKLKERERQLLKESEEEKKKEQELLRQQQIDTNIELKEQKKEITMNNEQINKKEQINNFERLLDRASKEKAKQRDKESSHDISDRESELARLRQLQQELNKRMKTNNEGKGLNANIRRRPELLQTPSLRGDDPLPSGPLELQTPLTESEDDQQYVFGSRQQATSQSPSQSSSSPPKNSVQNAHVISSTKQLPIYPQSSSNPPQSTIFSQNDRRAVSVPRTFSSVATPIHSQSPPPTTALPTADSSATSWQSNNKTVLPTQQLLMQTHSPGSHQQNSQNELSRRTSSSSSSSSSSSMAASHLSRMKQLRQFLDAPADTIAMGPELFSIQPTVQLQDNPSPAHHSPPKPSPQPAPAPASLSSSLSSPSAGHQPAPSSASSHSQSPQKESPSRSVITSRGGTVASSRTAVFISQPSLASTLLSKNSHLGKTLSPAAAARAAQLAAKFNQSVKPFKDPFS
ncbi:uncharacterized protein MONOS_976 [Monocercomonoides exilis]|uniref:uncharacterized protein n=1 Tax=Monocercomonoides exilis TaxID=2049356 RepID=UPI003559523A|nr:hypothetical protein MONOS_976 [Monocercomonoides exilis]